MDNDLKKELQKIANTVKGLSMDGVQKANSGHPGLPLGCAELGAFLYGTEMRYNPKNSSWLNRDRLVLSAGHGSMWLYSLLHLSGFNLPLDELKRFRQMGSITPGHPEYHMTDGVEATTGPLGQGIGNSVGMALGFKMLQEKFNTNEFQLFDNKIFCLAGDGCMMEGISSEASCLAGHLGLDNLVLIYDSNKICLDGPISECLSEDTKAKYRAYGWDVFEIEAYDFDAMTATFREIRENQQRPVFIEAHTIIGRGSPHLEGTNKVHGAALGEEELKLTKKNIGLPEEDFYVPQSVTSYFQQKQGKCADLEEKWNDLFRKWSSANPDLAKEFDMMKNKVLPNDIEDKLKAIEIKDPIAGRSSSYDVLNQMSHWLPQLVGGSADLSGSDKTMMKDYPIVKSKNFAGKNIKFGVREFAMSAATSGIYLTQMFTPYCGTFFTFSDYMRNAIRLASLSHYHVIYQFTHDSIFLGEDGPTHQPVEHLAALRAVPNLHVCRPGDSHEVKMCWLAALKYEGPTAIILSRQATPIVAGTDVSYKDGVGRGGYIVRKEKSKTEFTLFATGTELPLANEVADRLEKMGKAVRLVSMPCWEIFDDQPQDYKDQVVEGDIGKRVSIEAAADFGWSKYIGRYGVSICVEGFGHSAPIADLEEEFGFTVDSIVERLIS